ncbi:hypothetical protein ACOM2C_06645 [Pseudarthrobacter sp. So.54]
MTFLESAARGILPTEYAELITKPVTAQALAFNPALATVVNTGSKELQVPILNSDSRRRMGSRRRRNHPGRSVHR